VSGVHSDPRSPDIRGESRGGGRLRRLAPSALAPRRRLVVGMLLIALALISAALGRGLASSQHHAYDNGAEPLSSYRLTAGITYQLSASGGVAALQSSGLLDSGTEPKCFAALSVADGGTGQPVALPLESTRDDSRDLHMFATFVVSRSGNYAVTCEQVAKVFVDDADNSEPGHTAALVLLAAVAGVFGVGYALSGLAEITGAAREEN
jgi:hypothetical protein